ncbi:MAG: hypothetical protein L6R41_004074 [Letrouitia leprolyta]|nr:MAG: hypothetical protein L6R41_004074 [Letrouitia leprolyta]
MARSQGETAVHFVTLDVFTQQRFSGNPLAIVEIPLDSDLSPQEKQRIAREFNYSETVFLHAPSSGATASNRRYDIFTTTEELPFAGHPTIGTIVHLCQAEEQVESATSSMTLQAKAGPIIAQFNRETRIAEASITNDVRIHQTPVQLQNILNVQPSMQKLGPSLEPSYPLVSIVKGMTFVLINLPRTEDLAELIVGGPGIDRNSLKWDDGWVSFTAPYFYAIVSEDEERKQIRIRSRMIEPVCGEDPATGSAASALCAYLALRRASANTAYSFTVEQGIEMGRHSTIGVKIKLDSSGKSVEKVVLSGSAVRVSQGKLML